MAHNCLTSLSLLFMVLSVWNSVQFIFIRISVFLISIIFIWSWGFSIPPLVSILHHPYLFLSCPLSACMTSAFPLHDTPVIGMWDTISWIWPHAWGSSLASRCDPTYPPYYFWRHWCMFMPLAEAPIWCGTTPQGDKYFS